MDGVGQVALGFQFTLPRGERPPSRLSSPFPSKFQFTLPRGERRLHRVATSRRGSFNSRSRVGSDIREGLADIDLNVSIHAPAWGATFRVMMRGAVMVFQFTLPRGERPIKRQSLTLSDVFQFTLPRGERPRLHRAIAQRITFQFTLPRGERLPSACQTWPSLRFNSRSRVGSDSGS